MFIGFLWFEVLMSDPVTHLNDALGDRYRIERELGEGGMATVYLAEDLKHDRLVAVKVFKAELATAVGSERFLAEIRTTAGIQHPHVLQLFDSGEADGLPFYVTPFVEGESLRDRLDRVGQLPIPDAVRIATEVAAGLQAAHDASIVHRDVKPANILLGSGGAVIADFGIALALRSTDTERLTQTGMSIGTPHYMSPEQATGDHPVTERSDVYALGCVLYEMLVGEPPHRGKSVQSIVANILSGEVPRPRSTRTTVPKNVEGAVLRAIERVPADRFASCQAFGEALHDPSFRHGQDPTEAPLRSLRKWRAIAIASTASLALVVAFAAWATVLAPPEPAPEVVRFSIPFQTSESYATGRSQLALSPDGSHIAFIEQGAAPDRLKLRARDQIESWVVPGSVGALDPFFSADGTWIGYATVDALFKVPLTGGAPERIIGFSEARGVHWAADGWIYFGSYSGLWRVREDGGELTQLSQVRTELGETIHSRPVLLPGVELLLFTIGGGGEDQFEVATLSLAEGTIEVLGQGISPTLTAIGMLFGRSDGTVMITPFDVDAPGIARTAQPALEGVTTKPGVVEYAVSENGHLVYLGGTNPVGSLVMVGRDGAEEVLIEDERAYNGPRFSPDGRRLTVGIGTPPTRQVWIMEVAQRQISPLTYEGNNYYGIWTPDGADIFFAHEVGTDVNIYSRPSNGSGTSEVVLQNDDQKYPETWSPDGSKLLFRIQDRESGLHDIWTLDPASGLRPLLDQPPNEESPKVSPDGRWLAYASDLSGSLEVYLTSFPEPGGRTQVSIGGGTEPVWAPGGDELFYWRGDTLVAAEVDPERQSPVLRRTDLFTGVYRRWPFHANYDVHPDGRRFVMIRGTGRGNDTREIIVAVNWLADLRRRLDSN
jgi:serine/threonine-protein kinase